MSALVALGLLSAAGWASLVLGFPATGSRGDVLQFLGTVTVLFLLLVPAVRAARRAPRGALGVILGFAAAFRLLALFAGTPAEVPLSAVAADLRGEVAYRRFQLYDDDLWRYLWDGHVTAAGFSPYARSPAEWREEIDHHEADPREAALLADPVWWERLDLVRFANYATVYPPGAQALFRASHAVAPGSVFVWKAIVALADLVTCWLVIRLLKRLGRAPEEALLYAWNPLAIKEIAASGHVDGACVLLLVLGVERLLAGGRSVGMAAILGAATVKIASLPLLPLVLRRTRLVGWALLAAAAAIAGGYAAPLGDLLAALSAFAADWELNAGPWALLRAAAAGFGLDHPEQVATIFASAGMVLLTGLVTLFSDPHDDRALVRGAFVLCGAAAIAGPAVMPWYLLWALPFALALGDRSWLVLGALSFGSYLVYSEQAEPRGWVFLEYGAFVAVAVAQWWRGGWDRDRPARRPAATR